MYRYETHLHTKPASRCAQASVRDNLTFYRDLGYDGVFITNHFLDGNVSADRDLSYAERLKIYLADYEEAKSLEKEIGIKVFFGAEMAYSGTDFLVYGLDGEWYAAHPEIMEMKKSVELPFLRDAGAFIAHAHPFREANYIDHIRLFPRCIECVEVMNANRTDFENHMAEIYAREYGFLRIAGSDNHLGAAQKRLAGVESDTPIVDENDFISRIRAGTLRLFCEDRTV